MNRTGSPEIRPCAIRSGSTVNSSSGTDWFVITLSTNTLMSIESRLIERIGTANRSRWPIPICRQPSRPISSQTIYPTTVPRPRAGDGSTSVEIDNATTLIVVESSASSISGFGVGCRWDASSHVSALCRPERGIRKHWRHKAAASPLFNRDEALGKKAPCAREHGQSFAPVMRSA